jgi:acetyl esterase/lipase
MRTGTFVTTSTSFRSPEGHELTLDVHRADRDGPAPAVVYFHGGGWARGDRSAFAAERHHPLASRGITVVSASYRFSGEAAWPAQLSDARAAVQYVVDHAEALGVDPARVSVWGASAGGHLATMLGLLSGRTYAGLSETFPAVWRAVAWFAPHDLVRLAGDEPEPDAVWPSAIPRPTADSLAPELRLVGAATAEEGRSALRGASPVQHVSSEAAPLLLVAGNRDAMMPLAQARRMARRLAEAGVVHQLLIVDGATHEDPVFHSDAVLGAVAGWVGHRA